MCDMSDLLIQYITFQAMIIIPTLILLGVDTLIRKMIEAHKNKKIEAEKERQRMLDNNTDDFFFGEIDIHFRPTGR